MSSRSVQRLAHHQVRRLRGLRRCYRHHRRRVVTRLIRRTRTQRCTRKVLSDIVPLDPCGYSTTNLSAFLASSDSSFMTASELPVDGGLAQV